MKLPSLLAGAAIAAAVTLNCAGSIHDHYGLQLYSLRELAKVDLAKSLDLTKEWGVVDVETAGTGGLPVEEFKKLLDARGLKAVSMHAGADRLDKEMDKVIHEARVLGVTYIVCPWYPHDRGKFDSALGRKAVADFNRWGAAIKAAGFQYAYHPHGFEFAPTGGAGDERVFDQMVAATDTKVVKYQMDVFWVYHAGVDPLALLKRYPGIWVALHVKDMRKGALRAPSPGVSPESAPPTDKVVVGTGEIEWPSLLAAADAQGVKYAFVEDESLNPVENIPQSLKYLRSLRK